MVRNFGLEYASFYHRRVPEELIDITSVTYNVCSLRIDKVNILARGHLV